MLAIFGNSGDFGNPLISHRCLRVDASRQARSVICYLGERCHRNRRRMFPVITLFAVLGEIETLDFMMLRHTQTDDYIDEFKNRERSHYGQRSGDPDSDRLVHELMCVPFRAPEASTRPVASLKMGLTALLANTPVNSAPSVPPAPWTPKASSESS